MGGGVYNMWVKFILQLNKITNRMSYLQSIQFKRIPPDSINELIILKLNSLVFVDFRLISAFLYA